MMSCARHVACIEERNAYRVVVRKPYGKRPNWEANIKRDLKEIGWSGMDWIHLAQDKD
jgi:hypothetical protein